MKTFYSTFGKKLIKQRRIIFRLFALLRLLCPRWRRFYLMCYVYHYFTLKLVNIMCTALCYSFQCIARNAWRVIHSANHTDNSVKFGKIARARARERLRAWEASPAEQKIHRNLRQRVYGNEVPCRTFSCICMRLCLASANCLHFFRSSDVSDECPETILCRSLLLHCCMIIISP